MLQANYALGYADDNSHNSVLLKSSIVLGAINYAISAGNRNTRAFATYVLMNLFDFLKHDGAYHEEVNRLHTMFQKEVESNLIEAMTDEETAFYLLENVLDSNNELELLELIETDSNSIEEIEITL